MKYIYDVILNFNEEFLEFYEWKDNDNIEYVKKIPLIKISDNQFADLKNNKIIINNDIVKNLYNRCEVYTNSGIENIEYASLFCTNDAVIALEFNEKGVSIFRSDLLIDESLDILEYTKKMKITKIEYDMISKYKTVLITRKEIDMISFIKKELINIYKCANIDKLNYIYYECFNKLENNINKIMMDLEKHINNSPYKIFELLMLSYSKGLQK